MSVILTCAVAVVSYWIFGISIVNYINENEEIPLQDKINQYKLMQASIS